MLYRLLLLSEDLAVGFLLRPYLVALYVLGTLGWIATNVFPPPLVSLRTIPIVRALAISPRSLPTIGLAITIIIIIAIAIYNRITIDNTFNDNANITLTPILFILEE